MSLWTWTLTEKKIFLTQRSYFLVTIIEVSQRLKVGRLFTEAPRPTVRESIGGTSVACKA